MRLLRPATHHLNDRSHRGDQIAGCGREFRFASLDFGDIQHLVDQFQEVLAAAADRVDVFTLIGGWVTLAQEAGGRQDDAEGRTKFVAHIDEEEALRPGGGLRLVTRLPKFVRALINQRLKVLLVSLQFLKRLLQPANDLSHRDRVDQDGLYDHGPDSQHRCLSPEWKQSRRPAQIALQSPIYVASTPVPSMARRTFIAPEQP